MNYKLLFGFFVMSLGVSMILGALHNLVFIPKIKEQSKTTKTLRAPINATCVIKTHSGGLGTGVTLDTGYILTAGHIVDANDDDGIDEAEREVKLTYYGDISEKMEGTVVYFSPEKDIAFIEPKFKIVRGVKAAKARALLGERVVTIGATKGAPPMISPGVISEDDDKTHRVSSYISTGNSGGGVFKDSDNEVVGIIRTVRTMRKSLCLRFIVPLGRRLKFVHTHASITTELNGVAGYVPIDKIREDLAAKQLEPLLYVQPIPGPLDDPFNLAVLKASFHTLIILLFAYAFRKYLFT